MLFRLIVPSVIFSMIFLWSDVVQAAPIRQLQTTPTTELRGELPTQYSKHFFGITPLQRDGLIRLTLAYEPAGDRALRGLINFVVLSEDGLRRHLAGSDLNSVNLARGEVLSAGAGNLMETSFQASGRGAYTVIVYNNLDTRARYILTVDGGILTDDAEQSVREFTTEVAQTTTDAPDAAYAPVTALRLTGALDNTNARHYISVRPSVRDGRVVLRYSFDPQDEISLRGRTNFYVLAEDGIRRIMHGDDPEMLNIATGYSLPFAPTNELSTDFNASGYGPYLAVLYNESTIPATYVLQVDGGLLEEQVGQTREGQVAATEFAALGQPLPQTPGFEETPPLLADGVETINVAEQTAAVFLTPSTETEAVGELAAEGVQHYWSVAPLVTDGILVLTLEYFPHSLDLPFDPVNFWVLDAHGLRQVVAGTPPQDVNIAVGSPIQYGAEAGKLRAVFNASGYGPYTVVVTKGVDTPMQYLLRIKGGELQEPEDQLDVAQTSS